MENAIAQKDIAPSAAMAKAPSVKKRKRAEHVENNVTDELSATNAVENSTQAQVSVTSTVSAGNGFGEVHLTEEPSTRSIYAGDRVERNDEFSGRGLLPIKHKNAVGTSYAQPAIFPGQVMLDEQSQDKFRKVQIFSSQKLPQPFLDR